MSVEIAPASADRFEDLATLLGPSRPDGPACWCLAWRLPSGPFGRMSGVDRREMMRGLCGRPVAPGLLAYVDGTIAGWCNCGPRTQMGRLERSQTIPAVAHDDVEDDAVWSVVCFVVRTGYRRQGLARTLLKGAVDFAHSNGAAVVEGYPFDAGDRRISGTFAYMGSLRLFESVGFAKVAHTTARSGGMPRVVVARRV